MRLDKYDISYDKSIVSWDEGLPLGNGKLGSLIYGDGPIRVAIDRVDLWDNRPNPKTQAPEFNYQNLVRLSTSGKEEDWKERLEVFEGMSSLANPSSITAGRLEMDFGVKTQNIRSRVSLKKAVAEVEIDEVAKMVAFTSATRFVGIIRIYGAFEYDLHIPNYISGDESGNCKNNSGIGEVELDHCLRYPRAKVVREGEFTYYAQKTLTDYEYGVVVLRKNFDGYSELYYTVETNVDDPDYISFGKKKLEGIAAVGFDKLFKEHTAWWKEYWKKSEISVGDPLLEKVYYRSWYLFASCSRKGFYPMSLQGVWIADNDSLPPWKGDYHHDTNTQLSYQSYLKANRLPEGEVFLDYLWSIRPAFRRFAKTFYGVDGLLIPGTSTLDGKPIGGWVQYALSPTMSVWTAQSFDEYYLYTGDESFLKERAYPFFQEIGQAIEGILVEKNGKLYLPLSTSPEIFDATPQSYLTPNSNFDQALLIYLFKTLKGYAETLGEEETAQKYAGILAKLDEISIEEGKYVMLDPTQRLRESHRHFSHLMCLYPLHLINYDTDEHKKIYEGSLEDIEFLGMGMWVGFSYAMCAQIYAMAYKGNSAYEKLLQFANGFVAENGFHLNGDYKGYGYTTFHYRPFTLESSFGYCDALHEMLMQDHQGYLHLFPAVPLDWDTRKLAFKNLRSVNGVLVSAERKNGKVGGLMLLSEKAATVRVKNVFGRETLRFSDGQTLSCKDGEIFTLSFNGEIKLV